MADFIIAQIMLSIILCSSTILFKLAAKTSENSVIGYRTKRSSLSVENWILANNLCSRYFLVASLVNLFIGLIFILLFSFNVVKYSESYIYLITVQLILSVVLLYISVENKLKHKKHD